MPDNLELSITNRLFTIEQFTDSIMRNVHSGGNDYDFRFSNMQM